MDLNIDDWFDAMAKGPEGRKEYLAGTTSKQRTSLNQRVFDRLKSAFSSGSQRDESYTQRTTSYVDLMTVDFNRKEIPTALL